MSKNLSVTSDSVSYSFENASGPIDYSFTNDYMFRAILQQKNHVLKGLICSLLHLQPENVASVEITNPVLLGDNFDAKEFILDIDVTLNNAMLINLEMQVANRLNWPERSLSYLCRRFDQLGRGQAYINCKPAIHIGFLNYTPFPKCAEFYATYKLLNIKNQNLYSDKFILHVVDLTHIELATDEDKAYGIDLWAKLFKATTWEDIKMIAKNNPVLSEASESLFLLNADDIARQRSRAREEYNALIQLVSDQTAEITSLSSEIERLRAELAKYQASENAENKKHTATANPV